MKFALVYSILGSASYAHSMVIWYTVQFDKKEFHDPNQASLEFVRGFLLCYIFWPIIYPILLLKYFKHIKKERFGR